MIQSIKKVKDLLSKKRKQRALTLVFLLIIGMILEMLGIGLILPVLTIMIDPNTLKESFLITNSYFDLSHYSQVQLISGCMVFIILLYLVKSIFFWFLNIVQSKFIFGVSEDISNNIFKGYLYLPFSFHAKFNSSQLLRNVQAEVIQFTYAIQSLMNLTTEFFLSLAVTVFLFFMEPVGTSIIFFILAIVSFVIYRITKTKLGKLGLSRQYHEGECSKHLLQGLNGIKEVKILGKEIQFFDFFSSHNKVRNQISSEQYAIQNSPKILLEFFSILGLVILVFSVILFNGSLDRLIPLLGVFAAASFRLLPSINRIVGSAQLLKFTQSALDKLYSESMIIRDNKIKVEKFNGNINFTDSIQVNNLSFSYPGSTTETLSHLTFEIPIGKSIGIIGESGSGKSTLINILLGLLDPSSGRIQVDKKSIHDNIREWQSLIGYVPQFIYLTDDTIRSNIAFGVASDEIDEERLNMALEMSNLSDFVSLQTEKTFSIVGERGENLSGGQRQRLGIARALYTNPSLLILDEATSSLDMETEKAVMESIDSLKGKRTMIIVAHRFSTLENCDWIIRLDNGKIIEQGTAKEVLKK